MDDQPGPYKRLRKNTRREGMLTSDDLNNIMNWSSDEDVYSGSSWSGGNEDSGDSSEDMEENIEPIVVVPQIQTVQKESDVWHEDKFVAQPIPFTGTPGLFASPTGNKPYDFFKLCASEKLFSLKTFSSKSCVSIGVHIENLRRLHMFCT